MLQTVIDEIAARMHGEEDRGKVADYIPELSCVDPGQFALSICLANGVQYSSGDADVHFSMQSISKIFTLAIALGRLGDGLWRRVGREPSNSAFNSVVEVELTGGRPRNPFMNAGAILVTDAVLANGMPRQTLAELLHFIRAAAGDEGILINPVVAASEKATGDRNWALAHYLRSCGNLTNTVDLVLGTYFHQCAIELTCVQLARAGRFLAGIQTGPALIAADNVRNINALMMTCGHYDGSGEFAFRVGIPAKSGVGGGILAVVPGVASIAVWSPGLNRFGNSKLGTQALELLSKRLCLSLFEPGPCQLPGAGPD